jgi:O-succinylbenzoic acid--CoA ligase
MTETISHIALKNLTKNESSFTTLSSYTISENDGKLIVNAPEIGVHQLQTNDLIRTTSSTKFEWIGRADFTINSGGYKFQPEQLEVILTPYISSLFFFTKEPDPTFGEIIVMIVEKNQSSQDEKSIRKICKRELPIYAQPKNIRFIAHIISTPSGKINRVETLKSFNS